MQQMVDELEAAWESKSPAQRTRMHTHFSDQTPLYKKLDWNWLKDATSTKGQGGYPYNSKVGISLQWWVRVVGQGVTGSGNQGAKPLSKPIICYSCGKPGHTRKDCYVAKILLSLILSDSGDEEFSELFRVGTISGQPCRCMIDTGANRTTVPAN